jgi:DNA-binding PadR family transcriptional regulator
MAKRDLSILEYIVLGLCGLIPQSGYDITTAFEDGSISWSASPGSVYPMLKRLEGQGLIVGNLEMEYETRPKKVYTLTDEGGKALDEWLNTIPSMRPFYEQREVAQLRFQFMEKRLPREQVLTWVNGYIDAVRYASQVNEAYTKPIQKILEENTSSYSLHSQLLMEAYLMEINTVRTWLELVKNRLTILMAQEK